jgi:mannosyl-oligosaccharide glucosidase
MAGLRDVFNGIALTIAFLLLAMMPLGAVSQESGDASVLINEIALASNASLLWGPYRPNLYFGIRPRIPKSLLSGLFWAKVEDFQTVQHNIRHTCEQHEGMAGYGWDEYDVRTGGRQIVRDKGNTLDMVTEFIKVPGGSNGGSWGVRVKGMPREDGRPDQKSTVIFYTALEGLGHVEVENEKDTLGIEGTVSFVGNTAELGDFRMDITDAEMNVHPGEHYHPESYRKKPLDRTMVHSLLVPEEQLWQTKSTSQPSILFFVH